MPFDLLKEIASHKGKVLDVPQDDYSFLGVNVPEGITIRAPGSTFRGTGKLNQQIFKFREWSEGATLEGATLAPNGCIAIDVLHAKGVTLRNLTVDADYEIEADADKGGRVRVQVSGHTGVAVDGCDNLLIDGLNIPRQLSHYGIRVMGQYSRGVIVRNYTHHGSVHEHGMRTTAVDGLTIQNMRGLVDYADPGTKNVGALSIRNDGRNITVIDSELHGLGIGPQNTDPPTSTTENVTLLRCALSLNVTHYGGARLKNVVYRDCTKDGKPYAGPD